MGSRPRSSRRGKLPAGRDVKIGGGVSIVRQYLQAGLIDDIHFAMTPVALGRGEAMFTGIDLLSLGFTVTERAASEFATHLVLPKVIDSDCGYPMARTSSR